MNAANGMDGYNATQRKAMASPGDLRPMCFTDGPPMTDPGRLTRDEAEAADLIAQITALGGLLSIIDED